MIIACTCVILHYGIQNKTDIFSFQKEVYFLGIAMAVFATVLPSFLVSEAIKHIGASNFGIIGSLGPISTIILANIFLNEKMTPIQIMGTMIVIGGVFILARKKSELKNDLTKTQAIPVKGDKRQS
jgi:drug/metabolite transporter (DMT)-like permease